MSDEPIQPPSGDAPGGESAAASPPDPSSLGAGVGEAGSSAQGLAGAGLSTGTEAAGVAAGATAVGGAATAAASGGLMAAIMGSQITAYATLLIASLVTITGSMYVLS